MNTAKQRIEQLRVRMKQEGIDYYIVPTADFHHSEYVNDYFKVREFLSGFTGSNGTLVISADEAGLWTDGRYFVQAERELEGSDIVLYRMGEENVPKIEEYLGKNVKEGQTIGFDGRVVSASFGKEIAKAVKDKNVKLVYDTDMVDALWQERPKLPTGKLWIVPEALCGETVSQKLAKVREKMAEEKAEHLLISKLDDIMWLYNIRGNDIDCNPVALSYAFISMDEAVLFVQKKAVTEEVAAYLKKNGIVCKDYDEIVPFIQQYTLKGKIWCAVTDINFLLYQLAAERGELVEKANPTELLKAVKNPVELENIRKFYLLDSVVLTKFLFWVKEHIGKEPLDEYGLAVKLDAMRSEIEGFLDISFDTISAYGANAAMMHYEATQTQSAQLKPEGLYLVDSGGQYLGATTDVTRTIALGSISDEIKKHFSKTVCGMLRLAETKFLSGCTGRNLDIMARQPLWECYMDYKCGTGHGIGYILNVHEGPHSVRCQYNAKITETELAAGMIVSDEPGVYIKGSHGIRIENILEIVNEVKNSDGQFMGFRHLTYVPIDLDVIDTRYMEPSDIKKLNNYHALVYQKLEPYFEGAEKEKLREATRAVG